MTHQRQEIRDAVKKNLARLVGFPIHTNYRRNLYSDALPSAVIHTKGESSFPFTDAPRINQRTVSIEIEVVTEDNDTIDATLDAHAKKIEEAMNLDETLDGLVRESNLVSTRINIDPSGERQVGSVTLTYEATYHTDETPYVDLDELESVHVHLLQ